MYFSPLNFIMEETEVTEWKRGGVDDLGRPIEQREIIMGNMIMPEVRLYRNRLQRFKDKYLTRRKTFTFKYDEK